METNLVTITLPVASVRLVGVANQLRGMSAVYEDTNNALSWTLKMLAGEIQVVADELSGRTPTGDTPPAAA